MRLWHWAKQPENWLEDYMAGIVFALVGLLTYLYFFG